MALVIVEGVDGAGKTTLINKLQKDLNLITIKSPRPKNYHDCKDLLARTMLLSEGTNLICDRIGIISEPIYGPICRNTLGFPPKAETEQILFKLNPIIIHCNPPIHAVLENVKVEKQMEGVNENLIKIHQAYNEWMGQLAQQTLFVLEYDYTKHSYQDLLDEIRQQLDEIEIHPLDREVAAVQTFHRKFGVDGAQLVSPGVMDEETFNFRVKFMQEELDEFTEAYREGNIVKMFDALLDLTYVVKGTALFMGITSIQWAIGFDVVHNCNVTKIRAPSASHSKRGSALDVIKPAGWTGPEEKLKKILDV